LARHYFWPIKVSRPRPPERSISSPCLPRVPLSLPFPYLSAAACRPESGYGSTGPRSTSSRPQRTLSPQCTYGWGRACTTHSAPSGVRHPSG